MAASFGLTARHIFKNAQLHRDSRMLTVPCLGFVAAPPLACTGIDKPLGCRARIGQERSQGAPLGIAEPLEG